MESEWKAIGVSCEANSTNDVALTGSWDDERKVNVDHFSDVIRMSPATKQSL